MKNSVNRRDFLWQAAAIALGTATCPGYVWASPKKGGIVAIFDDLGSNKHDKANVEKLLSTSARWVGAVLPGGGYVDNVCKYIRKHPSSKLEVILHHPMEPVRMKERGLRLDKNYGTFATDNPEQVKQILRKNIEYLRQRVGHDRVIGVNYHMGSKAMTVPHIVQAMAEVLAEERLIFVDSGSYEPEVFSKYIIKTSKIMKDNGVRAYHMNLWLGDGKNRTAQGQFKKAADLAAKGKRVIGIGHIGSPMYTNTVNTYIRTAKRNKDVFLSLKSL